jgi:zinc/manganese transport system substrate-binding protein
MRTRSPAASTAAATAAFAIATGAVVGLAGCASPATPATDGASGIAIVASTNVYGDIAKAIAGDLATVTSLVSSAAQDPHSFEASARDQLAVSKADIIVANGGGYDPFIDTLLAASGNSDAIVLSAATITDLPGGANEHLWYDFDAMDEVAAELATRLSGMDVGNSATYESNYEAFSAQLGALDDIADGLADRFGGTGAAITEPVPLYLLEATGLVNSTPAAFSQAIEEGTDVSPTALRDTLDLFSTGSVALLAYNEQTASPETEKVRAAAAAADIPVVDFTETLPDGVDYVEWMSSNLAQITSALGR